MLYSSIYFITGNLAVVIYNAKIVSALTNFHGHPGILCGIVLSLGYGA